MEGETQVPDLSLRLFLFQKFHHMKLFGQFPVVVIHGVDQIKIKIFRLTALQLFVEDLFNIRLALGEPGGHLIHQKIAGTGIFFQQFTQADFTLAVVVHVGSINVIDARLHGKFQHFSGFCVINIFRVLAVQRQTHGPEPQQGDGQTVQRTVCYRAVFFHFSGPFVYNL